MKSIFVFVVAIVLSIPSLALCETTHGLFMWVENAPNTAPLPHSREAVSKIKDSLVTYGATSSGSFTMQQCKRRFGRSCRDDVLNAIRAECKKVGEEDTFLFVWSSHGSEQDNDQHFYLADGEGIYLSEILKTIGESSKAKANFLIISACRTAIPNQSNDPFDGPANVLQVPNTVILNSANSTEYSWGSIYLGFIADGLSGKADANDDESVSVYELFHYAAKRTPHEVKDRVKKEGKTQTPTLRATDGTVELFDHVLTRIDASKEQPVAARPKKLEWNKADIEIVNRIFGRWLAF